MRAQADELVMSVVQALDGVEETETVDALLRLRTALEAADDTQADPRRSRTRSRRPRRSWSTSSTTSSATG